MNLSGAVQRKHKWTYSKKIIKFPLLFLMRACIHLKEMVILSAISTQVVIEILDNFLIPSEENWFGDDDIFFQKLLAE